MANVFDWEIENKEAFDRGLERLGRTTSDFRIPLTLIGNDFYKSQKQLFQLKGPGLYKDLADSTKKQKAPNVYPILVGKTGDLAASTLSKSHKFSLYFLGKQELLIGTTVPYGKFHQSDKQRTKIPQRKFIFITGGAGDKSADSGINGRKERWLNIMNDHVLQVTSGAVL